MFVDLFLFLDRLYMKVRRFVVALAFKLQDAAAVGKGFGEAMLAIPTEEGRWWGIPSFAILMVWSMFSWLDYAV